MGTHARSAAPSATISRATTWLGALILSASTRSNPGTVMAPRAARSWHCSSAISVNVPSGPK